eukprot:TRINITY_DN2079_c0_g1_i2.p1 TRINITY_DN2079_c0_g1~~TRINITY_DN2079_c0_g1_i2.p1  ORF type:complete len:197 (+),score=39.05 TRINITY_DN2079_c0_g1_i2:73-663(+)
MALHSLVLSTTFRVALVTSLFLSPGVTANLDTCKTALTTMKEKCGDDIATSLQNAKKWCDKTNTSCADASTAMNTSCAGFNASQLPAGGDVMKTTYSSFDSSTACNPCLLAFNEVDSTCAKSPCGSSCKAKTCAIKDKCSTTPSGSSKTAIDALKVAVKLCSCPANAAASFSARHTGRPAAVVFAAVWLSAFAVLR